MKSSEKQTYIVEVDAELIPLGFKRRKNDQEWHKSISVTDEQWIHLNFGLAVINPSFGVQYKDLERLIDFDVKGWTGSMRMLSEITVKIYSLSDSTPKDLTADIRTFALPVLEQLSNRQSVIESLQKNTAKDWPVPGLIFRKRLLPLLLVNCHHFSEALAWLKRFEVDPPINEHPGDYAMFASKLREHILSNIKRVRSAP